MSSTVQCSERRRIREKNAVDAGRKNFANPAGKVIKKMNNQAQRA
ncbi:hypothetical protein AXX16_1793 [Serratia rubidaea]|nr:hypothetical protein AXX16_1793 [Serratia rubidaea]